MSDNEHSVDPQDISSDRSVMRPGQNLIEFALIALPIIVGAALLQSTLLPVLSSLFSGITQTILSLRV